MLVLRKGKDEMIFDFADGRSAEKTLIMNVPISSHEDLFNRLRQFASDNGFSFRNPRIDPDKERYAVHMFRRDVAISGGSSPFSEDMFDLSFYIDAKQGGTTETMNALASKLRDAIAPIAAVGTAHLR
jgi:hypothetical protein